MSVIVEIGDKIHCITKGADSVIEELLTSPLTEACKRDGAAACPGCVGSVTFALRPEEFVVSEEFLSSCIFDISGSIDSECAATLCLVYKLGER